MWSNSRHWFYSSKLCSVSTSCCQSKGRKQACDFAISRVRNKKISTGQHQSRRSFLSAVSATGFNDYELERKRFKWEVPTYYNFANVMDAWAEKERNGERLTSTPALWWVHEDGQELKFSFQDIQEQSKKYDHL
ncbi:Acyl-coenzyme A synthetase ACSM3, mitochondrial [Holothuria leucospilota]|uniref:Acyl-coenzyme A synthetase ACSM3, mitochondrial n=1 Tax=Holothuria leucospilota TaxID=206669 RepID=A0A9Q1C3T5_HOLLE|nr:Acyl-coenzyme A synthetase ACSM3, mitochondrial [Holothuria leucospilota]